MTHLLQLVVDLEGMRLHRLVAGPDMRRQGESNRWGQPALVALALERQTDRIGMGHITFERLEDGGIELARAIALQQLDQARGDAAEVRATLGGADE